MIKIVYRLCIQYAIEMYNKYEMLPVHFVLPVYQSSWLIVNIWNAMRRKFMKSFYPKFI